jgi:hypothetical protein
MVPFLFVLLAGTAMILLHPATVLIATATLHRFNISGTLYCSNNGTNTPMPSRFITLLERDGAFNCNDLLGKACTDSKGHFEGLVGEEDEGDEPEAYLKISVVGCHPDWRLVRIWGRALWVRVAADKRETEHFAAGYSPRGKIHGHKS